MKHTLFDEISEGFETLIRYRAGKANHQECLQTVNAAYVERIQSLVGHIEVDLDSALLPEDE